MNEQVTYEELLDKIKTIIVAPNGKSMLPLLKNGLDTVQISKKNHQFHKYDIILYKRNNDKYVLHRIIKVKKNEYVLCGDNQLVPEYNIKDSMILGVMNGYYHGEKYIDVTNIDYKKYSRKRVRNRKWRWIIFYFKKIFKLKKRNV